MSDPAFSDALEVAIAKTKRTGLMQLSSITAVVALYYLYDFFFIHRLFGIIPVAIGLVVAWFALYRVGPPGLRQLEALRGQQVRDWFPSPSHGLVAITGAHVLGGKALKASFQRHDLSSIDSASYDEAAHAMVLLVTSNDQLKRVVVRMTAAATKERGYQLAKLVNDRAASLPRQATG